MSRRRKNRNRRSESESPVVDVEQKSLKQTQVKLSPVKTLLPGVEKSWVIILLGVGVFFRFFHLGFQSIWRDELATITPALNNTSILDFFTKSNFGDGPHPPLTHIFVRLWSQLFGTTDWALRASTALIGCLVLFVAYRLAIRLFRSAQERMTFILFMSCSLFLIYYSQEVRAYIVVTMFVLLATERFLAWVERPSFRNSILYSLASAAIFFTHYIPIFVLFSHGFVLLVDVFRRRRPLSVLFPVSLAQLKQFYASWGGVHLISLIFAIPRLIYILGGTEEIASTFWMWKPDMKLTTNTLMMFFGIKLPPWALYPAQTEGIIVGSILVSVAAIACIKMFRSNETWWSEESAPTRADAHGINIPLLTGAWVLIGFWLPWLISYYSTRKLHIFLPRTVIVVIPGLLALLTWAMFRARFIPIRVAIVALCIGPSLGTMPWYYTTHHKQQWRDAVAYIDLKAEEGDRVQHWNRPWVWYSKRQEEIPRYKKEDLNNVKRIWVVRELQNGDRPTMEVLQQLQASGYKPQSAERFNALAVVLMVKP